MTYCVYSIRCGGRIRRRWKAACFLRLLDLWREPANVNDVLITPIQLVDEPLEFNEVIAPGVLDYASDIRQVGPLPVNGVADLLIEHRSSNSHVNDIRLRAHYSADFEILCARCVDPVAVPLEGDFDLIFRPGERRCGRRGAVNYSG